MKSEILITNKELFDELITEAQNQEFTGWDFSYISGRMIQGQPSWDYRAIVLDRARGAGSMLDMGTGGGEFLSSLPFLPYVTCATEGYPPNISLARRRLGPLGVRVFEVHSDEDLPFEDSAFDLVINRHESFSARQVFRLLKPGGKFLTQQVGGSDNFRLNELLQAKPHYPYHNWTLQEACKRLVKAGFRILDQQEEFLETAFVDIGAVVYYLMAVPWQIEDFTIQKYYNKLADIHNLIEKDGELVTSSHRFLLETEKPG
jgi:SAM-dependent methyltransferase